MRKIIFLDVDGVLNDNEVLSTREELGEHHLINLKSLVAATRSEIVLSSTWRHYSEEQIILKTAFIEHNIPMWIDQTPDLLMPRGYEITQWLKNNVTEARVLILDDDNEADIKSLPNVQHKFIRTCMEQGLTYNHVQEAIEFFNETKSN